LASFPGVAGRPRNRGGDNIGSNGGIDVSDHVDDERTRIGVFRGHAPHAADVAIPIVSGLSALLAADHARLLGADAAGAVPVHALAAAFAVPARMTHLPAAVSAPWQRDRGRSSVAQRAQHSPGDPGRGRPAVDQQRWPLSERFREAAARDTAAGNGGHHLAHRVWAQ
jgi:hypothetical protein